MKKGYKDLWLWWDHGHGDRAGLISASVLLGLTVCRPGVNVGGFGPGKDHTPLQEGRGP